MQLLGSRGDVRPGTWVCPCGAALWTGGLCIRKHAGSLYRRTSSSSMWSWATKTQQQQQTARCLRLALSACPSLRCPAALHKTTERKGRALAKSSGLSDSACCRWPMS